MGFSYFSYTIFLNGISIYLAMCKKIISCHGLDIMYLLCISRRCQLSYEAKMGCWNMNFNIPINGKNALGSKGIGNCPSCAASNKVGRSGARRNQFGTFFYKVLIKTGLAVSGVLTSYNNS